MQLQLDPNLTKKKKKSSNHNWIQTGQYYFRQYETPPEPNKKNLSNTTQCEDKLISVSMQPDKKNLSTTKPIQKHTK